jgi:hypothetical protein
MRYYIAFFCLAFFCNSIQLKAQFSVDAQLRMRAEINQGYLLIAGPETDFLAGVSQRSRLGFSYGKDQVSMRLNIQDIRAWGGETFYTATGAWANQALDVFEAWMEMKLTDKAHLRLGRQILSLDDERLIAERNWNQYGQAYDALRYRRTDAQWETEAVLSYNNKNSTVTGTPSGVDEYYSDKNRIRMLNYLWIRRALCANTRLSYSMITSGYQSPRFENVLYVSGTSGFHLAHKKELMALNANLFGQFGRNIHGRRVEAWMATFSGSYALGRWQAGVGADLLSGNDGSRTEADYLDKDHSFDLLYGARFKFNGYMNQFANLDAATGSAGLIDVYPFVKYALGKENDLRFLLHLFRTAQKSIPGMDQSQTAFLGTEADLMYTQHFAQGIRLQAGASLFFPTETMEALKGLDKGTSRLSWWTWVMLTYQPRLW